MMRSMFAGVSGLKAHQVRMDVIGNNIANVNTAGYKASRATFQEMLTQTMQGATAPTQERGGTNPKQVGLGVQLGSIDVKHTQGNVQSTGYTTDLAIEGDGFFILQDGDGYVYTRAGMFGLDPGKAGTDESGSNQRIEGSLVSLVTGQRVMGYLADDSGNIILDPVLKPIEISSSASIEPKATTQVNFAGNLDARYDVEKGETRTIQVFDSLGREHTLIVTLEKTAVNTWEWSVTAPEDSNLTVELPPDTELSFDLDGRLDSGGVGNIQIGFQDNSATPLSVQVDFSALTQFANDFSAKFSSQDGYASGSLQSFLIDQNGVIVGSFSNGLTRALGQIALAKFANPGGLLRVGSTVFAETPNSGIAQFHLPGMPGYGRIAPSSLEMSNVDLSEEFTEMIITQRGFQANSRIITTSDEMLQELVNLKR